MIIYKVNGNEITGLGHLYRIYSIIEGYNFNKSHLVITEDEFVRDMLASRISCLIVEKKDELLLFEKLFSDYDKVVIDDYNFDIISQKKLFDLGYKVIQIRDDYREDIHVDLVINHAPFYPSNISENFKKKALLGPKFSLLRSEFSSIDISSSVNAGNIFVAFGAFDRLGILDRVLDILVKRTDIKQIYYLSDTKRNISVDESRFTHLRNCKAEELVGILSVCELAIVSASTILFEVLACGVPVLSGYYVNNQMNNYKGFLSLGIIQGLGNLLEINELSLNRSIDTVKNPVFRGKLLEAQRELFDGKSIERVIERIETL